MAGFEIKDGLVIGTTPTLKSPSAIVQLNSITQGFLMPRLTTAEMNAIVNPEEGLEIYNSTTKTKWYFNGTIWINSISGGGASSETIATAAVTAFSNRTGVVNATITAALYDMIKDLDTNSLWSKMVSFYPMVGGNAFAHGTNLKDPLKYNLTFFGGWTHSANGALPNGINGYANTNTPYNAPELFFGGTYLNRTLAYYSRTVSASSGVLLGLNDGGQAIDYLYPNPITSAISGKAVFAGSTATTKLMAVSMADGTNGIFYRDTVSLPMAFYVTSPSISDPYFLAASNQLSGTPGFFSNCQCALAFISTGLTLAELNIVNTIVNSFQLALTRNV